MKFILTGTSGFIGGEILSQCLNFPSLTALIILSRRLLPEISTRDPRISIIVLENFLVYPEEVVKQLAGAQACLWTLGGSNSNPTPKGKCDEVEVQYPLACARAMLAASKNENKNEKMRFLFISGTFSVRNQEKSLWVLEEGRKARGLAELKLIELAKENEGFEAVVIKCGYVMKKESLVPEALVGLSRQAIRVDELAAAMIDTAINASAVDTIGNADLRKRGKKLLRG